MWLLASLNSYHSIPMSFRSFTNPRFQKEANLRTFLARMSLFEYSAKFISVEKLETVDSGSSPRTVYGIRQDDCWVQESMACTVTFVKNSDESVH